MNKKQYIAPKLCIELYKVVQNVMWAGSGGPGSDTEPGAPARNGEGTSVKLTKMYI